MEWTFVESQWPSYVRKHWFKLAVFGILSFIFFQKDLSFQLNLSDPLKVEEKVEQQPLLKSSLTQEKEHLTQGKLIAETTLDHQASVVGNVASTVVESGPTITKTAVPTTQAAITAPSTYETPNVLDQSPEMEQWLLESYIERFSHVAIAEQRKFNIPSSIIMANSMLHSFGGQNTLAIQHHNHFALPCESNWSGKRASLAGKCYRVYNSAWDSFRDHSNYLRQGRFEQLQQLELTNYAAWADGLEKLQFSQETNLAKKLVDLIESHKLYQLDLKGI